MAVSQAPAPCIYSGITNTSTAGSTQQHHATGKATHYLLIPAIEYIKEIQASLNKIAFGS